MFFRKFEIDKPKKAKPYSTFFNLNATITMSCIEKNLRDFTDALYDEFDKKRPKQKETEKFMVKFLTELNLKVKKDLNTKKKMESKKEEESGYETPDNDEELDKKLINEKSVISGEIEEFFLIINDDIKKLLSKNNKELDTYDRDILDDDSENTLHMKKEELKRKQITMKYGEIWQIVIGNFPGWENLGIGHETECDIRRLDNTAIVELKNKYNTCNSGSKKDLERKLTNYKLNNPNTECIWGIINEKKGNKHHKKEYNVNGLSITKWQGRDFLKYALTYKGINYTEQVIERIRFIMYN